MGSVHIRRTDRPYWTACVVSLGIFTLSLWALSRLVTATSPLAGVVVGVVVNGFATGAAITYSLPHMLALLPPESHPLATGVLSTFRGFAGSFGTALGGGIFTRTLRNALTEGFARLEGGLTEERKKLVEVLLGSPASVWDGRVVRNVMEREVAVGGYEGALRGVLGAAALVGVVIVGLQAATGWTGYLERKPGNEECEEEEEECLL